MRRPVRPPTASAGRGRRPARPRRPARAPRRRARRRSRRWSGRSGGRGPAPRTRRAGRGPLRPRTARAGCTRSGRAAQSCPAAGRRRTRRRAAARPGAGPGRRTPRRSAAAKTGWAADSSRPMPGRWLPWPLNRTAIPPCGRPPRTRPAGRPGPRPARPAARRSRSPSAPRTTARWAKAVRVVASAWPTSDRVEVRVGRQRARAARPPGRAAPRGRGRTAATARTGGASAAVRGAGAAGGGGRLGQHDVAVGAAHAEGADARDQLPGPGAASRPARSAPAGPARPAGSAGWGVAKLRLGGSCRCLMLRAALSSPTMPAAPSRCPMLVFAEPTRSGAAGRPVPAERGAERGGLDRVADRGAGAVQFDVLDSGGCDAGPLVRLPQHLLLRRGARRGQTVGGAVVVDGAAADHAVDRVAVGDRVRPAA